MSIFVKSILSLVFLAAGFAAAYTMFYQLGKGEKSIDPAKVRAMHRIFGYTFFALTIILSYFCIKLLSGQTGEPPSRVSFHIVLALALIIVLVIKISIAHFYKMLLRFVPPLGIVVLSLSVILFGTSGGYYLIKAASRGKVSYSKTLPGGKVELSHTVGSREGTAATDSTKEKSNVQKAQSVTTIAAQGDAEKGSEIFSNSCSFCHSVKPGESGMGPGMYRLFEMDSLPASGREVTAENIVKQLLQPIGGMPKFDAFTDEELADLLAYLKTL